MQLWSAAKEKWFVIVLNCRVAVRGLVNEARIPRQSDDDGEEKWCGRWIAHGSKKLLNATCTC
jgi:hypothetical protein